MLNSRACRSAIMFNDELSLEQCEALLRKLSGCAFPFTCAHGRVSMVPLVQLGDDDGLLEAIGGGEQGSLGHESEQCVRTIEAFKRWKTRESFRKDATVSG